MIDGYSMAAGAVDITPPEPTALAGYRAVRAATFERVADPLEANIVVLRNGGASTVFISLDLMYVGARLRDRIVQAASRHTAPERIFLSASHTHFGPPTEESLPRLGGVSAEYVDFVARRVIETLDKLLETSPAEVSLEYVQGTAAHSINRRLRAFGLSRQFPFFGSRIRIKPNVSGPRDDAIRIIRIRGSGNTTLAVCWSYACHPVGFPNLNEVSAEFPGVVRRMLRGAFGEIPVIFWQGFSGNIRPLVTGAGNGANGRPSFAPLSMADWENWSRSLGQCVLHALASEGVHLGGPISCALRSLSLRELGLNSGKEVRFHEVRFGNNLVICGLNAEVAVEYGEVLRRLRAPASVIPVGCVGDVFGYLPTSAMVPEGGYEAQGFLSRFGLRGGFDAAVGSIVEAQLLRRPK